MSKLLNSHNFYDPDFQAILQLAEEETHQNRQIKVDQLYKKAKRDLNINWKDLTAIIKYMFEEKLLVEGSKLIRENIPENHFRASIYQYIQKYPGMNFRTLKKWVFYQKSINKNPSNILKKKDFGSSGQFVWHLSKLMEFKYINKVSFKNLSLFVPHYIDSSKAKSYFLLRDKINKKIFSYLIENNSVKQSEIPELLELSKGSIYHRIKTMIEEDIIISKKIGRTLELKINPILKKQLIKIYQDIKI